MRFRGHDFQRRSTRAAALRLRSCALDSLTMPQHCAFCLLNIIVCVARRIADNARRVWGHAWC